jgi:AraC-like DNA-binding protein
MRLVGNIDELFANPVGSGLAGRSWLFYYPTETLCGFSFWGVADGDELGRLTVALTVELTARARPHRSLVDLRRLEVVDPKAFDVLARYLQSNSEVLREKVTHLAIVHPGGYVGALAAGFFRMVRPPYPVELFTDQHAALAWLGEPDDGVLEELDALQAIASGVTPLLRDLRACMNAAIGRRITLSRIAAELGLAPRTLQLRLRELGTTFRHEVQVAQVSAAQKLMVQRDASVTQAAFEVGCRSPAHFAAVFKKITGTTPAAWRKSHTARS